MICLIWLGCFGAVFPTLFGLWGKFSIDKEFGCSIVKDENGRNPKTYLFMLAFILPCCSIIICYARIFFIVRKATRNLHPVKVSSVFDNIESESLAPPQTRKEKRLSNRINLNQCQEIMLLCSIYRSAPPDVVQSAINICRTTQSQAEQQRQKVVVDDFGYFWSFCDLLLAHYSWKSWQFLWRRVGLEYLRLFVNLCYNLY